MNVPKAEKISELTINRLSVYLRCLTELSVEGLKTISSHALAERFNLKYRNMCFRITTSHAESVATEIQRLMASLKVPMQHFRVSMAGGNSIVELESEVTHSQQETIVAQLNRQRVITEVMPVEDHRE